MQVLSLTCDVFQPPKLKLKLETSWNMYDLSLTCGVFPAHVLLESGSSGGHERMSLTDALVEVE